MISRDMLGLCYITSNLVKIACIMANREKVNHDSYYERMLQEIYLFFFLFKNKNKNYCNIYVCILVTSKI